jgi:3-hydroxybutyryl-CoA dehydrogenase
MGSGIAEVSALAGFDVVVVKATAGSLDQAIGRVEGSLQRSIAKGKLSRADGDAARARLTFSSDLGSIAPCDLVIESTTEALSVKKRVLADLEQAMAAEALLATNTSSLPLPQLAEALASPSRFLGLHFFSPVPAMKLVEIGCLSSTSLFAVETARGFAEALGKTPIVLGDDAGYIVNRLLVPLLCQAIELLEQGVASAEHIDVALKLGCGHPLGPLALSDLIGLDVVLAMSQTLAGELGGGSRFRAPSLLRRLVAAGCLGKKTKLGLYDYRAETPRENPMLRPALAAS